MEAAPKEHSSPYCPDCGPATVSHVVERWSVWIDILFSYITWPPRKIYEGIRPFFAWLRPGRMAPTFFYICAGLGLGNIVKRADDKSNWRTKVIWEEAERRGIVMQEFRPFGLPRDILFATYGNDTQLFDGLPRPRNARDTSINWMDDKGVILKKFRHAGVPVPRGGSARTWRQAEKIFNAVGTTVIVKPAIGSRSRHTYLGITDLASLRKAFIKAKQLSPYVVVEEELSGFVFRITLIGGQLAGVMRREPPHVMGDGKHTVRELAETENKNPLRHGPIFHELPLDGEDTVAILKEQSLSMTSVPEKGRMVILHPKVSRAYGASTTEIEDIHPENKKMFLKIGAVLDDPLVGVDFMIPDMARPWQEQKCGVIECNSLPFIDLHHYPLKGPARNVAAMVWDLAFPKSK